MKHERLSNYLLFIFLAFFIFQKFYLMDNTNTNIYNNTKNNNCDILYIIEINKFAQKCNDIFHIFYTNFSSKDL